MRPAREERPIRSKSKRVEGPTRFPYAPVVIALMILASGCDRSGIHPLGRELDIVQRCAGTTSTWVSSTPEGTEILLIEADDPVESAASSGDRCFAFGQVGRESSTHLRLGTYAMNQRGEGEVTSVAEYDFVYQPDLAIIDRRGSKRNDLEPPEVEPLFIESDGEQLIVTLAGESRRMTSLYDVVERIDPTTQEGAEDILSVLNLALYTAQARILGFGSAGMIQYVDSRATFQGLVRSFLELWVDSYFDPTTHMVFSEFEDLSGIWIDGEQVVSTNLRSDGIMRGLISFRFLGSEDPEDVVLSGAYDLQIDIRRGVAAGGFTTVGIDGGDSFDVPWDVGLVIDLKRVLPEEAP